MPRPIPNPFFAATLLSALLSHALVAQTPVPPQPVAEPPAEYAGLTNPLSAATNFDIETVRGLLLAPDGLFAINTHASTVVRFASLATAAPANEWPTVHNPVAITEANGKLLVVGGASWSLVEHDRSTGRILRHVALRAEPADIVVDPLRNEAYVACQGDNAVVRIDLGTFTENAVYPIPAQRPRFLFYDALAVPPMVYVTPALSGNNTTIAARPQAPVGMDQVLAQVVDLDLATPGAGLPDEDLFRIDPGMPSGTTPPAVLHGAGTLLTEHGRHPYDGKYWLLSSESLNGHPSRNSEDEHRGVFANAQLAIATNLGVGARPTPGTVRDLDVPIGGGTKQSTTSMSFPFALAFHPSGLAAIASSTSHRITFCDASGVRLYDLAITQTTNPAQPPMPPQLGVPIPRDLWWDAASNALIAYLWGWNKVFVWNASNLSAPPYWLDLGPDPLPLAVQRGRSIFYDATRPVEKDAMGNDKFPGAVTCNSCHPGGAMDLLGWGLSDSMKDIKDLMVTQSLLSIADLFPYHWRGERNLDHFNGAFKGLLGFKDPLSETPGGELDDFEAFVFSLQAPANRNQDISRTLTGFAARAGQQVFLTKPAVLGAFSCVGCHSMPGGTNGDRVGEVFVGIASTNFLDVAHLRQLNHKDQGGVPVVVPVAGGGGTANVQRARGGFGIAHDGTLVDLRDFIGNPPFNITPTEADQITAFVRQFDQGIAPAAHRAYLVDAANLATVGATVNAVLLAQAAPTVGWIDVAAIGHEPVGGTVRDLRWAYDPATATFQVHDGSLPARNWAAFQAAITGGGRYLFVGLPPANARRYALDPDNDDLTDGQEVFVPIATDPRRRDTDGDGYDDGYEVQVGSSPIVPNVPSDNTAPALRPGTALVRDHSTATFAKLFARFTEPVTWQLEAVDPNHGNAVVSITKSDAFAREATIHMHELYPSTPFGGDTRNWIPRLTIRDPRGNPATFTGAMFATTTMLEDLSRLHATIASVTHVMPPARGSGQLAVNAQVSVRLKGEWGGVIPFLQGHVVVAHVLKRPAGSDAWSVSSAPVLTSAQRQPGFQIKSGAVTAPYTALPGDFLLAPLTAQGTAAFTFTHSGLVAGDDVRLSIVAVVEPVPNTTNTFELLSLFDWDLSTTPGGATPTVPAVLGGRDARGLTTTY